MSPNCCEALIRNPHAPHKIVQGTALSVGWKPVKAMQHNPVKSAVTLENLDTCILEPLLSMQLMDLIAPPTAANPHLGLPQRELPVFEAPVAS